MGMPTGAAMRSFALQLGTAATLAVVFSIVSLMCRTASRVSPVLGPIIGTVALVMLVVAVLCRRTHGLPARLIAVNMETGPRWRSRRFLTVLVPGAVAMAALVGASLIWGNRAWGALAVLQVDLLKTGSQFDRFGDLAQFVDAATCPKPLVVGTDVCDFLHRPLNQNPLFVHLLDPIGASIGLTAFGVLLAAVTVVLIALLASLSPTGHLVALPLLFSPAAALALERGNAELVVLLFTAPGLLLLSRRDSRAWPVGVALLTLAAVLKVFPIFALLPMLGLRPARRAALATVGCVIAATYWLLNAGTLRRMLAVTQRGSAHSYGLNAIFVPQAPTWLTAMVALVVLAAAIMMTRIRQRSSSNVEPDLRFDTAVAFAAFYLLSFFAGANWAYRLVFSAVLTPTPFGVRLLRLQVALVLLVAWTSPTIASAPAQLALAAVAAAVVLEGLVDRAWFTNARIKFFPRSRLLVRRVLRE